MHPRFFTSCTPRLPERFPEKCPPKVLHSWFDNGAKKFNEEFARWKELGREKDFNNQFISSYINNNISTYQNISNGLHNNVTAPSGTNQKLYLNYSSDREIDDKAK